MKVINGTKGTVNDYYVPTCLEVGDDFVANKQHFIVVTDEQARSYERVMRQQGITRYLDSFYNHLDDYLAVRFEQLYVGIEPDGYTHS